MNADSNRSRLVTRLAFLRRSGCVLGAAFSAASLPTLAGQIVTQRFNLEEIKVAHLDRRRWKHLILHHSATLTGNSAKFDRFHRERHHMENGLAYHFVIGNGSDSGDGEIEIGPRWAKQLEGGHVSSRAFNENSIGVCLVGNFEEQRPTPPQLTALIELLGCLKRDLVAGNCKLLLHREVNGERTLCPGRHFPAERIHRPLD